MSTAREGAGRLGPAGRLLALGALALAYFSAGRLGLSLAFVHESATAVWPPTGIALAASLVWGYQVWPAVLLGAFLKLTPYAKQSDMTDEQVYAGVEKALRKYFGKRGDRVVQDNMTCVKRGYGEMRQVPREVIQA